MPHRTIRYGSSLLILIAVATIGVLLARRCQAQWAPQARPVAASGAGASFSPMPEANGETLWWKYRINQGQPIVTCFSDTMDGMAVDFCLTMTPSDLDLSIDPATLRREVQYSGTLAGTLDTWYGGPITCPVSGTFAAHAVEPMQAAADATLIEGQHVTIDLTMNIGGVCASVVSSVGINAESHWSDITPPAEWFLDRSDLDELAVGYVYDAGQSRGGLYTLVTVCLNGSCTTADYTGTAACADKWEVVDHLEYLTLQGQTYHNVVKVLRTTKAPAFDGRDWTYTDTKMTYWAAQGVGMLKGIGQFQFMDQPLYVELIATNARPIDPGRNLVVTTCDFGPQAPSTLRPGDPVVLSAFVENWGEAATDPFWMEIWGSRTGGLTLDIFLADSEMLPPVAPAGSVSYARTKLLNSIPDGPYTVVYVVDRPDQIDESEERDNRSLVVGKRLLAIRPPTNADLVVEGFTFGPQPLSNGQPILMGGWIRNAGTQNSGPFWIEFWGSFDRLYPQLDFFVCDSIGVANLAPGEIADLSTYLRTLYNCPSGTYMVGVFADRMDQVNETDETNNYRFVDGITLNQPWAVPEPRWPRPQAAGPDLVIASADFTPCMPVQAQPGTPLTIWTRVENRGSVASGPFWLEFWGSKRGGLSLDEMVTDSEYVAAIPAHGAADLALTRSLYSVPDGPYTITVVADRPGQVSESNEGNNRAAVAGKRLLTIRPTTQANLVLEEFQLGPNPMLPGQSLALGGWVANTGTEDSGFFWIELWAARDPASPGLDFFLCDSIGVSNLAPGATHALWPHVRALYAGLPAGEYAVVGFVDRNDLVNETNETDNYAVRRGFRIAP